MPIIKLTKLNSIWNSKTEKWESAENSTIVFNTEMLIKAEENKRGGTHVQYREAMTNAFDCQETLEEFFNLCK
jgi:hypothetical protein